MIVRYSESIEIDPDLRFAIFAFAGKLEVYQRGMGMRDCVKAIMAKVGTSWANELETLYPPTEFLAKKSKRRQRRKAETTNAKA